MKWAYDLLEEATVEAADVVAYLYEPTLSVFKRSPTCSRRLSYTWGPTCARSRRVCSPDGTQKFARYERVLSEAQTPKDATNQVATAMTTELIEVLAAAALTKMCDPKITIADKLANQEGASSYALNADAHKATLGAHNVNDAAEVSAHAHAALSFLNTHVRACVGSVLRAEKFWPVRSRAASALRRVHEVGLGPRFRRGDAASRRQRKGA
eukprot:6185857-Pleurochrysis_carterae.AAC.1